MKESITLPPQSVKSSPAVNGWSLNAIDVALPYPALRHSMAEFFRHTNRVVRQSTDTRALLKESQKNALIFLGVSAYSLLFLQMLSVLGQSLEEENHDASSMPLVVFGAHSLGFSLVFLWMMLRSVDGFFMQQSIATVALQENSGNSEYDHHDIKTMSLVDNPLAYMKHRGIIGLLSLFPYTAWLTWPLLVLADGEYILRASLSVNLSSQTRTDIINKNWPKTFSCGLVFRAALELMKRLMVSETVLDNVIIHYALFTLLYENTLLLAQAVGLDKQGTSMDSWYPFEMFLTVTLPHFFNQAYQWINRDRVSTLPQSAHSFDWGGYGERMAHMLDKQLIAWCQYLKKSDTVFSLLEQNSSLLLFLHKHHQQIDHDYRTHVKDIDQQWLVWIGNGVRNWSWFVDPIEKAGLIFINGEGFRELSKNIAIGLDKVQRMTPAMLAFCETQSDALDVLLAESPPAAKVSNLINIEENYLDTAVDQSTQRDDEDGIRVRTLSSSAFFCQTVFQPSIEVPHSENVKPSHRL